MGKRVGIDVPVARAAAKGAVLCGTSAGAIIPFAGGGSDSRDPTTFKNPDNITIFWHYHIRTKWPGYADNPWDFMRAPGLHILPGFFFVHLDQRPDRAFHLLKDHAGESLLACDVQAAIVVKGSTYEWVAGKNASGTRCEGDTYCRSATGRPGCWNVEPSDQKPDFMGLKFKLLPKRGKLAAIIAPAKHETEDPGLAAARRENCDDGLPSGPRKFPHICWHPDSSLVV